MGSQEKRSDSVTERSQDTKATSSKDFMIGAIIGGMVGAAAALFLAPKSGKDLREMINEQASIWKDKSEQVRELAKNKGSNLVSIAKEKSPYLSQNFNGPVESTNKVSLMERNEELKNQPETNTSIEDEIQKKLHDTAKALEEEEQKIKG